jgi:hypothetical protein
MSLVSALAPLAFVTTTRKKALCSEELTLISSLRKPTPLREEP